MIPIVENAQNHIEKIAIISNSKEYTYRQLLHISAAWASNLLGGKEDLQGERIAFLVAPSFAYVVIQWAIWRAGAVAVPLCTRHPLAEIQYVLENADVSFVIADETYYPFLQPLCLSKGLNLISYEATAEEHIEDKLPDIDASRRAMILYTSGTTNKPKGVVSTHANISSQIKTLVEAWAWESNDRILNILPLHHVHGIINILSCALWSGAICEFLPRFDAKLVFEKLKSGDLTLFMAVPTIYYQLIQYWETVSSQEQQAFYEACKDFRLMVSGSAALPVSVLERWKTISGQTLLERYGMTEIGMALSNPYHGERRPGHVGIALPGVSVRLVNDEGRPVGHGGQGEIQVKGNSVFKEYWRKPQATLQSFTPEGWFHTGDIAIMSGGYYKILGRNNIDIIKSGGYKISALEIEEALLQQSGVKECAVVGLHDDQWGEIIAAALITADPKMDLELLQNELRSALASYKLPRKFKILSALPRNSLGKVLKKELKKYF